MKKTLKLTFVSAMLLALALSFTACISLDGSEAVYKCDHTDYEETVIEATCYEVGEVCRVCKNCGHTTRSALPMIHHEYDGSVRVDGDCQTYGYYVTACIHEGCTEKTVEYDTMYGSHDYEFGVCNVCGTIDPYYNGDAEDEPTTDEPTVDNPTVDEPGTQEHVHSVFSYQYTIDPTCTEAGEYVVVEYCLDCGAELSKEVTPIEKTEHTPGDVREGYWHDSTCQEEGFIEYVTYCVNCKEEIASETEIVEKKDHIVDDYYEDNFIDPTCTSEGSYEVVGYCINCEEKIIRERVVVGKLSHEITYEVQEDFVDSDCFNKGSYVSVIYCYYCDEELSRETVVVPESHWFWEGVCVDCGCRDFESLPVAEGLEYALSEDGSYYTVVGKGTYEGVDLVIPELYEELPVKAIASYAFLDCTVLESILIPEGIVDIGVGAFLGCTGVEYIVYKATDLKPLPTENGWNWVFAKVGFDKDGVEVIIGENVKQIPERLLSSAPNMSPCVTSLVFLEGSVCEKIGNYAFDGRAEITELVLPDSLISIGDAAFRGVGVKHFVIPENVTYIGSFAFWSSDLESLTFGANTKQFGKGNGGNEQVFEYCSNLKAVYFTGELEDWFDIVFYSSNSNPLYNGADFYIGGELVEELIVPESVTEIKRSAFAGCASIKSVVVHSGVVTIEAFSFYKCSNIESVMLLDTSGWYAQYYNGNTSGFLKFSDPATVLAKFKEGPEYTLKHSIGDEA